MATIDEAVEKIPKKWENVRSFHLKAIDSMRGFADLSGCARIWIENWDCWEKGDSGAEEILDRDEAHFLSFYLKLNINYVFGNL